MKLCIVTGVTNWSIGLLDYRQLSAPHITRLLTQTLALTLLTQWSLTLNQNLSLFLHINYTIRNRKYMSSKRCQNIRK